MEECLHRNFELFMSKWCTILVTSLKLIKILNLLLSKCPKAVSKRPEHLVSIVATGTEQGRLGLLLALSCLYTAHPEDAFLFGGLDARSISFILFFCLIETFCPCSQLSRAERTCLLPKSCLKLSWQFFWLCSVICDGRRWSLFFLSLEVFEELIQNRKWKALRKD